MAGRDDPIEEIVETDVFEVLGNETRLRIIQVLAEDRRVAWQYSGRTFAELRRSVGVRDAGTFAYHLDRLRDRFVVKDEGEYVLTDAGLKVADLLVSRTLDPPQLDVDRVTETETPCPSCPKPLEVHYENRRCAVVCPEHGDWVVDGVPPTAVADREGEAVLRYVLRDISQGVEDIRDGTCFHCAGRMRASLQTDAPLRNPVTGDPPGDDARDVAVDTATAVYGCERCETVFWGDPRWLMLRHRAVFALFHEADLRHVSFLDPTVRAAASAPDVLATDPPRVRVVFEHDGTTLELVLDETMTVVESSFG